MIKQKYVAFLRGINVGGHHKVPMAELRSEMINMQFGKVVTLLNSGNIIFEGGKEDLEKLEKKVSVQLEKVFGFPIPTLIREAEMINDLWNNNPFREERVSKDIRLYVSFIRKNVDLDMQIPWASADGSYKIIANRNKTICSVLDLSVSKTPKAMEVLERYFGKDITTRNWNTIGRIVKKLGV